MLYCAIHHEGVKENECVVVRIFNPGARRRSIVCCIPRLIEKELPAPYEYGLGWRQSQSDAGGKRTISCFGLKLKHDMKNTVQIHLKEGVCFQIGISTITDYCIGCNKFKNKLRSIVIVCALCFSLRILTSTQMLPRIHIFFFCRGCALACEYVIILRYFLKSEPRVCMSVILRPTWVVRKTYSWFRIEYNSTYPD